MNTLLIKNVLHNGSKTNILIEGNRFKNVAAPSDSQAETVIDATGKAVLPPFYNTHTHAAMALLRGYADDMPLHKWLSEYIWPFEDKMTAKDIYDGSVMAVKEMVQSGSVFFNDMYFELEETVRAVDDAGIRAALGVTFLESHSKSQQNEKLDMLRHWSDPTGGRIQLTVAPHAIYTVGTDLLIKCAETARMSGLKLHIHLSETEKEVEDCVREHGTTPVRYLDSIGFLGSDVIAAHVVYVDEDEMDILASRGVVISHCPCSNMKLASGIFKAKQLIQHGCKITLGTDGDSSNNNQDMRETAKIAALLAKVSSGDPEALPAEEALRWATSAGAEAFGIDAGKIEDGRLADCLLLDLENVRMMPCYNLVSNWIYAADSTVVDTVICDGKIVYER
ncbi:MAG: amidohydrolase [Bacteroidales bacterium]|nr:amidohydrolase [Candidatus Cacconaster merdequi]